MVGTFSYRVVGLCLAHCHVNLVSFVILILMIRFDRKQTFPFPCFCLARSRISAMCLLSSTYHTLHCVALGSYFASSLSFPSGFFCIHGRCEDSTSSGTLFVSFSR